MWYHILVCDIQPVCIVKWFAIFHSQSKNKFSIHCKLKYLTLATIEDAVVTEKTPQGVWATDSSNMTQVDTFDCVCTHKLAAVTGRFQKVSMTCQSLVSSQHSRLSFSFNFKTDIKFVISKLKNLTRLSLKSCYLGKQWNNSASHEEWHLMHVEYELKQCCRTWSCAQFKERRGDNHALKKYTGVENQSDTEFREIGATLPKSHTHTNTKFS